MSCYVLKDGQFILHIADVLNFLTELTNREHFLHIVDNNMGNKHPPNCII